MPYFYAKRTGRRVELAGTDAQHLARSLRARPGEVISVVEPEGRLLTVRLDRVTPRLVSGVVEAEHEHRPEPARAVVLAAALLPAASLELVLSRCTEVGAAGFLLVQAQRSIARAAKPERWAAICREAAMLAGRLAVPAVRGPLAFADAWRQAEQPWLLDHGGAPIRPLASGATLFVGPEGGWAESERAMAGERRLSLGPRNLRADTAAVVGLVLALADPISG